MSDDPRKPETHLMMTARIGLILLALATASTPAFAHYYHHHYYHHYGWYGHRGGDYNYGGPHFSASDRYNNSRQLNGTR
jgi:hypothetical protein